MGFRFSRRISVLPGLRLNLSRSGVSTSIGGRGAWLTFGRKGPRATVGLPGSGLSYTTTLAPGTAAAPPGQAAGGFPLGKVLRWTMVLLAVVLFLLAQR